MDDAYIASVFKDGKLGDAVVTHFMQGDYNILWVGDETRGIDAIGTYYSCYFRRAGRVE